MPDWIIATLKGMGVPGAIIFVLLNTIAVMGIVIKVLWKKYTDLNDERRIERAAFLEAMAKKSASDLELARSHEERNDIEAELGEAFKAQAGAFDRVNDRVELFHEDNRDKLKDIRIVVESLAEGFRTLASAVAANTATATEIRNWIQAPPRARAPRRRR
nr:MAG TPA: ATP synthase [Caudoviricetes sp.]